METSDRRTSHPPARASGILLHPTSLPGSGGIGDLGASAYRFLAWLEAAGQSVWQILPLQQPGFGASPYGALSSIAGNRLLISLDDLVGCGLLPAHELPEPPPTTPHRVDYAQVEAWKDRALRRAWARFAERADHALKQALSEFVATGSEDGWLPEWSLYAALKDHLRTPWSQWPTELRRRRPQALTAARREHREEIDYQSFVQFLFERQWQHLHAAASRRGIQILGDLPIYPAADSADVWVDPELFDLDAEGGLTACAGVPPDYFSPSGQLWGNPVYRWERHRQDGFSWWIRRLRLALRHADQIRLDHFRGFVAYWRVPAGAPDASGGRWVEAPGAALFAAVRRELGALPFLAEDLGVITDDVTALRRRFGLPGMKVLQFAFDEVDGGHLPHHHGTDSVVYTGTHDNDTTRGWYHGLSPPARRRVADYLGSHGDEIHWDLIRTAMRSVGRLAVIPVQDVLGLDSGARMNTPGAAEGNWVWRLESGDLTDAAAARLRRLVELSGRLPLAGEEATSDGARSDAAARPDEPLP